MINKLTVRNKRLTPIPYWSKVGFLKDRKEVEFKPGLNIVFGPNGCLDAETEVVYFNEEGVATKSTLAAFHKVYNQTSAPFYMDSEVQGTTVRNQVLAVVATGTKPCVQVTCSTPTGKHSIVTTLDHKFWNGRFFVPASDLHPFDSIVRDDLLAHRIESIVRAGPRQTFDISMKAPHNNFIANGFVVHNSGKSTLLSALAVLLHVKESNWPVVSKDSLGPFMRPTGLATGLLLEHDGGPARYLGIADPGFPPKKDVASQRVRLETAKETKYKALHDMSHGQATVAKLVSFLSAKPTKVRYSITKAKLPGAWEKIWDVGTESLANVRAGVGEPQQVILLDEVDRSLDFAKQHEVWRELREMAKTTQIIIASHSPFAVSAPGAHYIETTPDYLEASRRALHLLMRDLEPSSMHAAE